jgi:hypothetical protein
LHKSVGLIQVGLPGENTSKQIITLHVSYQLLPLAAVFSPSKLWLFVFG